MSSATSNISARNGALSRLKFGPLWLAAPALAFVAVFLLLPMLRLIGLSFAGEETAGVSLEHYQHLAEQAKKIQEYTAKKAQERLDKEKAAAAEAATPGETPSEAPAPKSGEPT